MNVRKYRKIIRKFNGRKGDWNISYRMFFNNEKDAINCCEYLNEIYIPMIILIQ